ncbi:MAG: hypothetical protein Q3971_02985 [Moraxella sp.]|nr:hypothetical protein [Moraxella sp.]
MKNQITIHTTITNIGFELELSDKELKFNQHNPATVARFIERIKDDYADKITQNADVQAELAALQTLLDEHHAQKAGVSKDDLKAVYTMLKDRQLHPTGEFDKQGRFWLEDSELVDVRTPSTKYPYSQMTAGRTSKFVKAMAEKYKPQTLSELIALFSKKN